MLFVFQMLSAWCIMVLLSWTISHFAKWGDSTWLKSNVGIFFFSFFPESQLPRYILRYASLISYSIFYSEYVCRTATRSPHRISSHKKRIISSTPKCLNSNSGSCESAIKDIIIAVEIVVDRKVLEFSGSGYVFARPFKRIDIQENRIVISLFRSILNIIYYIW